MASSHNGTADNSLRSMSAEQQGNLLNTLSETPDQFYITLQQCNCQEIRDLLRRETDKEKKYKGLTKAEMISILLETILNKKYGDPKVRNTTPKRRRENHDLSARSKGKGTRFCQNLACQASLIGERFCKRCSCYICHKYDSNKETNLWLTCDPLEGESCVSSYHLACALESVKSGLKEDLLSDELDASFYCVACGKQNSSLESWKKQLMAAKEAVKVLDLRNRLVYAQQLLKGTKKYRILSEATEEAASSLVAGLERSISPGLHGPLNGIPLSRCRGPITRLGPMVLEVRKHCAAALELFEGLSLSSKELSLDEEEVLDSLSLLKNGNNPSTPLQQPAIDTESNRKGKRVSFNSDVVVRQIQIDSSSEQKELVTQKGVPEKLPITPLRSNQNNDHQDRLENGINMEIPGTRSSEYDHCVKIIRELELSGYIECSFRQKFVTWFSLRARAQELVVFKTLTETFVADPAALANQLIHTFTECMSTKRSATDGGDGSGAL